MSAVMIVVGIFFVIGIAVGVITVVALSAIRRDRRRGDGPPAQGPGGSSRRRPDGGPEDSVPGAGSRRRRGTGYWSDSNETSAA